MPKINLFTQLECGNCTLNLGFMFQLRKGETNGMKQFCSELHRTTKRFADPSPRLFSQASLPAN